MDQQWALGKLRKFLNIIVEHQADSIYDLDAHTADFLRVQQPTVFAIINRLDPHLLYGVDIDEQYGLTLVRRAVTRSIGMVEDMEELAEHLPPEAPTMRSDNMHAWVWEAARTYWDSRHYRTAVDAATRAINAHTQTKVGRRDLYNDDLMNHVFTEKPKAGQRYLRIPGDPTDTMVKNRNRALRPFAQGCFAGLRNLAAHEHADDWPEQVALESLAALSILARWIDECEVVTAEDPSVPAAP